MSHNNPNLDHRSRNVNFKFWHSSSGKVDLEKFSFKPQYPMSAFGFRKGVDFQPKLWAPSRLDRQHSSRNFKISEKWVITLLLDATIQTTRWVTCGCEMEYNNI